MRVSSILGNSQKLDGGAMFGNAPKALWTRWVPEVDDRNRIDLHCRALLVETGQQNILFESGIGAYMEPHFKDRFGVQESHHVLLENLGKLGLSHEDIDVVILSHLHFDHAGGLLTEWQAEREPRLLFSNATFYVGEEAWQRSVQPHPRDRASFIPQLNQMLSDSGRLKLLKPGDCLAFDGLKVSFFASEGHTPGMMCADLRMDDARLVFGADLIPGKAWVHLPITMGYDRFPERLIDEKQSLLAGLAEDGGWLFFTHDSGIAAGRVIYNEAKKRFACDQTLENLERLPIVETFQ